MLARFNTFNLISKAVTMSSSKNFCNSVDNFLIFSPKTDAIFASNSFLPLIVVSCFKLHPPFLKQPMAMDT